jgi:hypothetical protein
LIRCAEGRAGFFGVAQQPGQMLRSFALITAFSFSSVEVCGGLSTKIAGRRASATAIKNKKQDSRLVATWVDLTVSIVCDYGIRGRVDRNINRNRRMDLQWLC